jgi:hypothetical protein
MPLTKPDIQKWQKSPLQVFWSKVAPQEHLVQIYHNELTFLNTLEGYAGSGLMAGETVVIIATPEHLRALEERLSRQGFDIEALRRNNRYFDRDAAATLRKFMVDGRPDKELFNQEIGTLYRKAAGSGSSIRAFGEMVVLLWREKHYTATLELENLWNDFCARHKLSLLCAYPRDLFDRRKKSDLISVCCAHSKVIAGWSHPATEVCYSEPDALD